MIYQGRKGGRGAGGGGRWDKSSLTMYRVGTTEK